MPNPVRAAPPKPVFKTIHVAPLPSLLALDPTTDTIYLRGRYQLNEVGTPISGETYYLALNGRTGQVLHIWPDDPITQTSTIPSLDFFHTGNGLEAYLVPTALTKLGLIYVGINRSAGYILGEGAHEADTLVTVDVKTRRILHTRYFAGIAPVLADLVLDPSSGWVAAVVGDVLDTGADLLTFNAGTGRTPVHITYGKLETEASVVVDAPANRVLVASTSDVEIYTLDTLKHVATIANLYYDSGTFLNTSYVNRDWDSEPVAVDPTLGRSIIINPTNPNDVNALSVDGTALIVDDRTGHVLYTVPIGQSSTAVQVDAQLHRAYIANSGSHDVTVLDMRTGKQAALLNVGSFPVSLALDTQSGQGFVVNSFSNTVTMFPLTTTQGATASYPPPPP